MMKDESRDRAIRCRYNPTEVGTYVLHIQWCGEHVPGSPFSVAVVDTRRELHMLAAKNISGPGSSQAAEAPLVMDPISTDFDGSNTLRMSTIDGMFFNDDV